MQTIGLNVDTRTRALQRACLTRDLTCTRRANFPSFAHRLAITAEVAVGVHIHTFTVAVGLSLLTTQSALTVATDLSLTAGIVTRATMFGVITQHHAHISAQRLAFCT